MPCHLQGPEGPAGLRGHKGEQVEERRILSYLNETVQKTAFIILSSGNVVLHIRNGLKIQDSQPHIWKMEAEFVIFSPLHLWNVNIGL